MEISRFRGATGDELFDNDVDCTRFNTFDWSAFGKSFDDDDGNVILSISCTPAKAAATHSALEASRA